jgi:hypothetical protein
MKWRGQKLKVAPKPEVNNSEIEAFGKDAASAINEWNRLHAKKSEGRLLLEIEGGNKKCPTKEVRLLADTGTELRPARITLILVRFEEGKGLMGSNPSLLSFGDHQIDIERFKAVIKNFNPATC